MVIFEKSKKLFDLSSTLDTLRNSDRFAPSEDKITRVFSKVEDELKISLEQKQDFITGFDDGVRSSLPNFEKGWENDPCEEDNHCQTGSICEHR